MNAFLVSLLVSQSLFARTYGGPNYEWVYSVIPTSDNGLAVAGLAYGEINMLFIKLNSTGDVEWARTYGSWLDTDIAHSVIQTSDRGYALIGHLNLSFSGSCILKMDSLGNPEWGTAYYMDAFGWEDTKTMAQTSDGGFVVAGTGGRNGYPGEFLIYKLDPSHNLQWYRAFERNTEDDDVFYSVIQTTDGGYAAAGSFVAGGDYRCILAKFSSSGDLEWAKRYSAPSTAEVYDVIQTPDGGYAMGGIAFGFGAGESDLMVIRTDPSGNLLWASTFGGPNEEWWASLTLTPDGGYAIAGESWSFWASRAEEFLIVKMDSLGNLEWARTFGGDTSDYPWSITSTSDGCLAIAGGTRSYGAGAEDVMVLKMGMDGSYPLCVQEYAVTAMHVTPTVSTPTLTLDTGFGPYVLGNFPDSVMIINPIVMDVCASSDYKEREMPRETGGVTCSLIPGGVLFLSSIETGITIYSADGRVAYLGKLQKGENRISLETGVYFWKAGTCRGKTVVK